MKPFDFFWNRSTREGSSSNDEVPPMKWKSQNPEMDANIFSRLLFFWLQPLFTRAAFLQRRGLGLELSDLAPLPTIDLTKTVEGKFIHAYENYKPKEPPKKEKSPVTPPDQNVDTPDAKKVLENRLACALLAVCKRRLIAAGVVKFFNTSLQFAFPILLNQILLFFENIQSGVIPPDAPATERNRGYWLSCLLFLFISLKAITENAYFHLVTRCSWQVKAAVSSSVYTKSLRLASSEQQKTTLGEIVNLMQIDATKLEAFVPQIHVLWDGLFQVAGYMTILGFLIGWPCVIGLLLMCFAGPVMGFIMGKMFSINRAMVKFTDERVKIVNEGLQGIRCVKMYTWEESFHKMVGTSRDQELELLRRIAYLQGWSRAYMTALPALAAVVSFIALAYGTNQPITASTLFAALVAFDQLRFPLMFYPMALAQYAQAKVSLGRVAIFLGYKEVTGEGYYRDERGDGEIAITNATVYWADPNIPISRSDSDDKSLEKSEHTTKSDHSKMSDEDLVYPKAVVSNITLSIATGKLCAIVGRVGSGKSSLCAAILNETILGEGSTISVKGRVAYAAQSPWILNTSVRDNILFGSPFDEERYHHVLEVCQLTHDLEMLDDGDLTEIGEKGINLSGGQKQRVSVARAAYSHADVVILDDPLSALDPEVALKVFEECIIGFLKDRTRVLVTNQLQCLSQCDSIVALGRGGRVIEQGTFDDLMSVENGEVQRLLRDLEESAKKNSEEGDGLQTKKLEGSTNGHDLENARSSEPKTAKADPERDGKGLVTQEEREVGSVKMDVYKKYLLAGGGFLRFALVFLFFVLSTTVNLVRDVWVALWTSDSDYSEHAKEFYLGGYTGFAMLVGVFTFFRSFGLASFGVRASKELHQNLLSSVFRAPMSFFDTTPTGRILSRFSKDMYTIDAELSNFIDFVLFMVLSVLVSVATIAFSTPLFLVALLPLGILYFKILNYFRAVSRETKRLESISRSPVYSHFSETLGGLSTIRAYGENATFISDFESKLDVSTQAGYCIKAGDRWLSVRLELIGASIAGVAAVFSTNVVLSNGMSSVSASSSYASLAGLSLTYAIQITGMLQWVVRSFAQVEAAMNSAERVLYYSENIAKEAAVETSQLQKDADSDAFMNVATRAVAACSGMTVDTPEDWPRTGEMKISNLRMRYRTASPLVLKGLNLFISGGERVGVVGRTGSGKSSLLLCLLRIVEPELDESAEKYIAPVTIDGVDVLRIGLKALRSAIGIIPQNPVLFSGTIRSNMDPFDEYTDEKIWVALEKCGMMQAVSGMPDGLLSPVAEYGENLSQGQRQLLCLGRALLKQCRILLLDEATSSVDFETDREIQRTLREAFQGSTVLTIAHRVNTIMDSDKILVMKDGVAAEFGPPSELLQDENSLFSDIYRHSRAESDA